MNTVAVWGALVALYILAVATVFAVVRMPRGSSGRDSWLRFTEEIYSAYERDSEKFTTELKSIGLAYQKFRRESGSPELFLKRLSETHASTEFHAVSTPERMKMKLYGLHYFFQGKSDKDNFLEVLDTAADKFAASLENICIVVDCYQEKCAMYAESLSEGQELREKVLEEMDDLFLRVTTIYSGGNLFLKDLGLSETELSVHMERHRFRQLKETGKIGFGHAYSSFATDLVFALKKSGRI